MKTFNKIIIAFFCLLMTFKALAQPETCDIATNGIVSSPSIMYGSGTSDITFEVYNAAGGPCEYPINSVLVVVTLPATGLGFNSFVTPATGPFFDWSYDMVENVIVGTNHTAIGLDEGETVTARLNVLALPPPGNYPDCRTVVLDILNNPDGPTFPSNTSDGNDGGYTTITITPTPGVATVECLDEAVEPVPPFMAPSCSSPVISYVDSPMTLTCEGTRTWSFAYSGCGGCPYSSFVWTYTYTIDRTIPPSEFNGPVATSSTVNCADDIAPPTLPVIKSSCDETLSPGAAIIKSQVALDFSSPVTLAATQTAGAWYTDRYAPAGFATANYLGDNRLKHSISAADCEGCRPPAYNSAFYNTQGRKYDLGAGTNYMSIDLYVPNDWATSNKRMAGLWGTAFDGSNAVSEYPILEFTSDGMNPRFRMWPADPVLGGWLDLGLPSGFAYNSWVKLEIRLLSSGEFLFIVDDLVHQTTNLSVNNSVRIANVILQGHNTASPGVTYDIYWDNFTWRETYVAPACNGTVAYTYDYTDCSGLVFPWTYIFTVNRTEHPSENGGPVLANSTVACADLAIEPTTLPDVLASCGGGSLSPESAIQKSQITFDFSTPVTLAATQTAGAWYTDRYAPAGFATANYLGDDRLKHSISAADCEGCRPPAYNSAFYNTQGRKYDLGAGTNYMSVDLYVPNDWATSNKRMAGLWGTAFDGSNAVSEYPILEFTSDGMNPRFRMWPADPVLGGWLDLGLPSGFAYNSWVKLEIRLLSSGEFLFIVDDLVYQTANLAVNNSVRIANVILQGHNTASPGVTYDIYWDNFTWRENYSAPACNGFVAYTFDYIDPCNDLVFPWTYTYEVNDNVVPTFTRPADITLNKDANCLVDDTPSGAAGDVTNEMDNCSTGLNATYSDVVTANCEGTYTITRTWSLEDNCGNMAADQVQTITVTDITAPSFTRPADITLNKDANCLVDDTPSGAAGDVTNEMDNCSTGLNATYSDVVTANCEGTYTITRTWSLEDNCGNMAADQIQTITVTDITAPTFTRPADITLNKDANCLVDDTPSGAAGDVTNESDNCSTGLDATYSDVVVNGCTGSYTITRTWSLEDNCGNMATNQVQTITVVDNVLPVITILGDPTVYICFGETYTDAGATADDNCSGDLTSEIMTVNPVNTSIAGTYMVTYDVMDDCGNNAVQVVRTVIVRPHPTATISGTATVLQNAPTTPVVTFTGFDGTAPYTFYYSIQFNSDPPTYHWTAPPGNPVTVAQSNAVVGVFTYTLLKVVDVHGCEYDLPAPQPTAVITVISSCDLAPSVPRPINGSFVTAQVKQGVIQFTNAGPGPTNGTMTFRVSNISNFNIMIPAVSGTYDGLSCQNSVFTITPGTFFTTLTTNAVIPAGGNLRVGYINTAVGTGGSNGNLTITINNGTGGDNNNANNKSVRTFIIN